MINASIYTARRAKLHESLSDQSVVILFSGTAPHRSRDASYPFSVNRNFYYMTGLDRENMIYVATKSDGVVNEEVFIERPNPDVEKWNGKKMRQETATERSGLAQIRFVEDFEIALARMLMRGTYETLYLDLEQPEWQTPATLTHRFAHEMATKYPYLQLRTVYSTISALRTVKGPEEVEEIKKAIAITDQGLRNLYKNAKPGMYEYELEAHFNYVLKSSGVKEHAFPTIIAGGERATILHYIENDAVAEDGELVLLDLGATSNYYNADISRTFPVSGRFTERQKTYYNIVLKAQEEAIAAVQAGVTYQRLNEVTKGVLARELKALGKITSDDELSNYYYHGVGHFLGLDTHDVGDNTKPIPAGSVITIEPGLYIADDGIGIRIEEDVLVTEDGCEVLSKDLPKTVEEIEALVGRE